MSNNLREHARADKVKWVIAFALILILIAGVSLALVKLFYQLPCKHEYEEGKCRVCGAAEPAEEKKPDIAVKRPEKITVKYNFAVLNDAAIEGGNGTSLMSVMAEDTYEEGIMPLASPSQIGNAGQYLTYSNKAQTENKIVITYKTGIRNDLQEKSVAIYVSGTNTAVEINTSGWSGNTLTINLKTYYDNGTLKYGTTYEVWGTANFGSYEEIQLPDGSMQTFPVNFESNTSPIGTFMVQTMTDLPPTPTKIGYTFTGWYTDEACTNKYTDDKVSGNITLYAGFKANTYSVKFNANGGTGTMSNQTMTYDKSANLTANAFTKTHFAFKGWATSADGGVVYTNSKSVKNLASAQGATVNLFAVWERSEWTVTFDVEGSKTTANCAVNTAVTLPAAPAKEGYTFVGWFLSNGVQYANQPITTDTTLTARFAKIKCIVTFIVDGEVYSYYECDYGTNLSELLEQQVDPTLFNVEGEYSPNF